MYREWLEKGLQKPGKTQADLARATGISHSVINRMVNGKRPIRDHEILKIAKYIEEAPPSTKSKSGGISQATFEVVPVVGVIQDGVWRDEMGAPLHALISEIPAVPSREYPGQRRAVQLAAPMEAGANVLSQYLFYVPINAVNRKLSDGDVVYVEIRRDSFVQQTALRLSSDGRAKKFTSLASPEVVWREKDVTVLGLVTGTHIDYRV